MINDDEVIVVSWIRIEQCTTDYGTDWYKYCLQPGNCPNMSELQPVVKSLLGANSCCVRLNECKFEVGIHDGTLEHEDEVNECSGMFCELNECAIIAWTAME